MKDVVALFEHTLQLLNKHSIKHQVHHFDSGAIMLDIWHKDEFFVVQFEQNSVGLSTVNKQNPGFDTIPDQVFTQQADFKKSLLQLLEKTDEEFITQP